MRILIDGYNLIRRVPDLKRLERTDMEKARDALVRELSVYRMGKKHRICVVFDGAEAIHLGSGAEKVRGISVRFSPRGSSADQVILEAMRNNEVDVLVSADRELTDAARRGEVTSVPPQLFWDKVSEEMYRRFKGEEDEEAGRRAQSAEKRKLSKSQRKDRARMEKL
jgi:predicted RNA-binding protein with PIN domain